MNLTGVVLSPRGAFGG